MAIEGGARAGIVRGRDNTTPTARPPTRPKVHQWDQAGVVTLFSDDDAHWDLVVTMKTEDLLPSHTWGTSARRRPLPIDGVVPAQKTSRAVRS
jgi:3-isopropylmalate/(R)-2-methylmalate dehydratase large subunit